MPVIGPTGIEQSQKFLFLIATLKTLVRDPFVPQYLLQNLKQMRSQMHE